MRVCGVASVASAALAAVLLALAGGEAVAVGRDVASHERVRGGASASASGRADVGGPACSSEYPKQAVYSVTVTERDPMPETAALISHVNGTTAFNFSFNSAWFPSRSENGREVVPEGLVVRNVECNPNHHPCPQALHPEWSNAGAFAVVRANMSATPPTAQRVSYADVVWPGIDAPPRSNTSLWGVADPRLTFRPATQTYFLTWDNCTQNCYPVRTTMLSTTQDPFDPDSWQFHGPLLPGKYTGGASIMFRDEAGGPHFAFVGNSDTANSILVAESADGYTWTQPANQSKRVLMGARPDCWDSTGVTVGAQPERLSTGDYLLIYNIDTGFPYHPNPLGRCAIGWAILDGDDPTQIVARSTEALLIASLPWEQCRHKGYACQETMVVFTSGMAPLSGDEFMIVYGGADTDVGVSKIRVSVKP